MADSDFNYQVDLPNTIFTEARSFKALANGKIYVGNTDTDPVNPSNQVPVFMVNEDGSTVQMSQPIIINAGGHPVYNGQIISKLVTDSSYSLAIYNAYG
ncbi:head-binding protein, partial [Enterobacteriaceae bacterium RIT711]|nr:head-binding protein [Enterobacteriaceae bacterium RIT711]